MLERIFDGIMNIPPESDFEIRTIRTEMDYTPSEKELQEIINKYSTKENFNLINVGFKISSEKNIMLDGLNIKHSISLPPLKKTEKDIISAVALYDVLFQKCSHLVPQAPNNVLVTDKFTEERLPNVSNTPIKEATISNA